MPGRRFAWARLPGRLGEAERQRRHAPEHVGIAPAERIGLQPQVRQAAQHRRNGKPGLQAGQRRPDAKVDGVAKRDMPIVLSPDVQLLGIGKLVRIAIRRAQVEEEPGAAPDVPPAQLQMILPARSIMKFAGMPLTS